jgi:glutamate racemase
MDSSAMSIDVLAGLSAGPVPVRGRRPRVLVFDSGMGGLTVAGALRASTPGAELIYVADDAVFPYGALDDEPLVARAAAVIRHFAARERADLVVVACSTASTLVLPVLRAELAIPVVGTVPAIKPAVAASKSGVIAVLATAGTIRRAYTAELVQRFAEGCQVRLVGAPRLAGFAERILRGEEVADALLQDEIAPCFAEAGGRRTDVVVLACTHFPLLRERLERIAAWPVAWIDPAPAIARRAASLLDLAAAPDAPCAASTGRAYLTGGRDLPAPLREALLARGFGEIRIEPIA